MNWIGLDIGGAHIKVATTSGNARSIPFRFWVEQQKLKETLAGILQSFGDHHVAATMTAELADCFESRQQGVQYIVDCLVQVCSECGVAEPVFAGTDLQFRDAEEAKINWLKTAAANWAMLAAFSSRYLPDNTGLVVDMGSTTTDVIPVHNGQVVAKGSTDMQRMQHGELIYAGAKRTPICGIIDSFNVDGVHVPVANELFATVDDAMILCGFTEEDQNDTDTADGRPRTKLCSAQRLSRMICEDVETIGMTQATGMAGQVLNRLEAMLVESLGFSSIWIENVVCTGSGIAFVQRVITRRFPDAKIHEIETGNSNSPNESAPAFAVAVLASEQDRP